MRNTGTVCDDERWPIVGFGLKQSTQGLLIIGTHGDTSDIDITIRHRDQTQILLGQALATHSEFRNCRTGSGLTRLATSVRIHFRIKHQDVDVTPACQYMVETTVADIIGPAVTTDNPYG